MVLKRAQRPEWMHQYSHSSVLELSQDERRSIQVLKDTLRNKFAHYIPLAWIVELHGMPKIALDVLRVVEFLALRSGNVRLEAQQTAHVSFLVEESREFLLNSQLYREAVRSSEL